MNRSKYIALYVKRINMNPRQLAKKLGYSKNVVLDWVNGYRKIKDSAMNHLILFRKSNRGSRCVILKPVLPNISNTGSGLDENAKIIADIIYFTDSEDRINLLLTISKHLKFHKINYTAELFKKMGVAYRRNYYE